MRDIRNQVRHSLRVLLRNPGTTVAIVLLLGLGIGANTAMFSIVNGVLLRPLNLERADRLVRLCETHTSLGSACVASPPNALDWRERVRSFEELGLARDNTAVIRDGDATWSVDGGLATPGFFDALRLRPVLGRGFVEEDLADGRRDVVILTDALWRERFGADPAVLGRSILHDGTPVQVIGVLGPDAEVPDFEYVALWRILPFHPADEANRDWRGFRVYARLADGATLEGARAELESVHADLAGVHPEVNAGYGTRATTLHEVMTGAVRPTLLVFAGALALLLVVACVNIANLLLAQATARRGEFAVRAALGASRSDVAWQLFVQSLLLGAAGALVALLVATWARSAFLALAPSSIPRLDMIANDARVFGFAAALALLTTLGFAIVPVLHASRLDLAGLIREQGGAGGGRARLRTRRALVVVQVALTTVLLAGAALLARSFTSLLDWQPGFETQGVTVTWALAPAERYADRPDATAALWRNVTATLETMPGVTAAGTASAGPLFGGGDGADMFRAVEDPDGAGVSLRWYDVGETYFAALGIPVVAGRGIDAGDGLASPRVALVNETGARQLAGDVAAVIGRRFLHPLDEGQVLEVVGVVRDVPPFDPATPVPAEIYWPQSQRPRRASYVIVRASSAETAQLTRALEGRMMAVEPALQLSAFRTYDDSIGTRLVTPRFRMLLIAGFSLLALALAATGTYGLLAWSVTLRSREIGIRMALGAGRRRVVRSILREGLLLTGLGGVAGLVAALWLARALRSMLFGVGTADPLALAVTVGALALTAIAACIAPARRAASVDPVGVMRDG